MLVEVIVSFGVLNDSGAGHQDRRTLWRDSWHLPVPMCRACWESARQVPVKYRPGPVVIEAAERADPAESSGGRA
jgi:hypothetical protein